MRLLTLLSLSFYALYASIPCHAEPKSRLNIVLIVVDTLGARHLGAYDSTLKHSPRIDALAKGGAKFERAYSTSSWTKPAIASIMTSKLPSRHGVIGPAKRLPPEAATISELFKSAGYRTEGIVSHTFLGRNSGFSQGFDEYHQLNDPKKVHSQLTSNLVSDQAIRSIDAATEKKDDPPFFLFLHYFDPHFRYQHHPEFDLTSAYSGTLKSGMTLEKLERLKRSMKPEDIRYLVNLYREEIAFTDKEIGRVMDHLDSKNIRKNTLVILTADHGEGFMEHGYLGHTVSLYEELVHVPLLFNLPGTIPPSSHSAPVSILDILPTTAALTGRTSESSWEGVSQLKAITGSSALNSDREILMEVSYLGQDRVINPNIIALRSADKKLLFDINRNRWILFDLSIDPGEKRNLAANGQDEIRTLSPGLSELRKLHSEKHRDPGSPDEEIKMPDEEIKRLKSLGYL